jgi:hypothetical protein
MTPEFDRVLQSIRQDSGEESVAAATVRVRTRLQAELDDSITVDRLHSCADFRALFPAYRLRALSEARQMLVEDHLHSCVACRGAYRGSANVATPAYAARKTFTRRAIPWILAAAAMVIAAIALAPLLDRALAGFGPRATVAAVQGELYRVSDASRLVSGAAIGENEEIRTAKDSRAVVRLRDGSTIEMAERSDLRISERFSGKTVHLDRGAVMVEAARQRRGHLEVSTVDCLVSVKGTIFGVTAGTKGSRVSVVEGEVKVDRAGASELLHRGDQKSTNAAMEAISVADDVAWSGNAPKYLTLLGELSEIQKRIEQIPAPPLRYESKLAGLLPENTVVFAAIPNPGATLGEATRIFEERVAQNETLREWWKQQNSRQLRAVVEQARAFSDYLGDEVVLALARDTHRPLLVAETRRPGLREYLEARGVPVVDRPAGGGLMVMVYGSVVAVGLDRESLAGVAENADAGGHGRFLETPFWQYISRGYQSGAGWIFAADMEQILSGHVFPSQSAMTGMDNVQYLMIERKPNLGRTENSAALSFRGERHGLASWLGAPGPMGTLDFVSPEASFAASFEIKNPATLLNDLSVLTRVNLPSDMAANLGGEMTVAMDGPLLPTPAWKIAIETENPAGLEAAIEQASGAAGLQVAHAQLNGLTYSTLTSPRIPYGIDYIFTDGYLLMAPSRALLMAAMQTRASGLTLPRSAAFRAQLPQDRHANFSALLYYNTGVQLAPILDQLKASGLETAEQQKSMAALAADRQPGLIYAYGEPDRIFAASRSGFFGLGLDTLVGLNAKGAAGLTGLVPPLLSIHATRN